MTIVKYKLYKEKENEPCPFYPISHFLGSMDFDIVATTIITLPSKSRFCLELWQPVLWSPGGMGDYNYMHAGCMELTLEVACCKYPFASRLPEYWAQNKDALLQLLLEGLKGTCPTRWKQQCSSAKPKGSTCLLVSSYYIRRCTKEPLKAMSYPANTRHWPNVRRWPNRADVGPSSTHLAQHQPNNKPTPCVC